MTRRCGLVALAGSPNAGKSSLLNAMVGAQVSIVTRKAQTTRFAVRGVCTEGEAQAVFVDAPGFAAKAHRPLEMGMRREALASLEGCDVAVAVQDAARARPLSTDRAVCERIAGHPCAFLVLNKVDIASKPQLLERAHQFQDEFMFREVFMVSARTGNGLKRLRQKILEALPPRAWEYPAECQTDMPLPLIAAEITRGALYERMHGEVPYTLAVETEAVEEKGKGLEIRQCIHVERKSQKGIVIGAGGTALGGVRSLAEARLLARLGRKVELRLYVKVSGGRFSARDGKS